MADIPGVPLPDPPNRKPTKRRVTTSKQWIAVGPLVPWMYAYAQWLVEHPDSALSRKNAPIGYRRSAPTTAERTLAASKFARRKITKISIGVLEQRDDFIGYFEKLRADAQFLAKELFRQDISRNIELRRKGLEAAAMAHDHKSVEHYTRPMVDLAFPKKLAVEEAKARVTINVIGNDAKALLGKVLEEDDEVLDVEWEEIPKQLTDGEEDE